LLEIRWQNPLPRCKNQTCVFQGCTDCAGSR
jgi:hypothetical protein